MPTPKPNQPSQMTKKFSIKLANNKFTIAFTNRVHCTSRENKENLNILVASSEGHFVKVIFTEGVAGPFHTLQGTDKV